MEQRFQYTIPNLACFAYNEATQVCCNQNCFQPAIVCSEKQCQCHSVVHKNCQFVGLNNMIEVLRKKKIPFEKFPSKLQEAYNEVQKLYNEYIQKISIDLDIFRGRMLNYGLHEEQVQFLQLVQKAQYSKLTGSIINKVRHVMDEIAPRSNINVLMIANFRKRNEDSFNSIFKSLRECLKVKTTGFDSNILKNIDEELLLRSYLPLPVQRFKLIYRGTQCQFSVEEFHKKCDGVMNTVVVVHNQFDKIIGGYTPLSWDSKNHYKVDQHNQSFLFSISLKEKYMLKEPQKAIYCGSGMGPCFGDGCDLAIQKQPHIKATSYGNFPTSYNLKQQKYQQFRPGQYYGWRKFTGAQQTSNFKVKEIQIFKVLFQR